MGAKIEIKFTYITDPGHGWLMVHKDDARQVNYKPTSFDYETEDHYYFEEDCSAPAFVTAYQAHHKGRKAVFDSVYEEDFRDRVRLVDVKWEVISAVC